MAHSRAPFEILADVVEQYRNDPTATPRMIAAAQVNALTLDGYTIAATADAPRAAAAPVAPVTRVPGELRRPTGQQAPAWSA